MQADHTVIAPPDLRADVAAWLASIAVLESDAGAFIYRLDPHLLTVAVQAGKTPESILEFLTELSSVPLAANIEWLVRDAARRAGRIRLISAPTVVVVSDPVDLVTACSVKAAKLRPISDTVAVSETPKVQAALERKGLVPEVVLGSAAQPPATPTPPRQPSSAVPGHGPVRKHLLVRDPLALTPDLVDTLGPESGSRCRRAASRESRPRLPGAARKPQEQRLQPGHPVGPGCRRYRLCHVPTDPLVEHRGHDVVRRDVVAHKVGQGTGRGQLHVGRDSGGPHIQRPAEYPGKASTLLI